MYLTLIRHAWLQFSRAHYFGRSLGVKAIIAFMALIFLIYLYALGGSLPWLLLRFFPQKTAVDALFSLLLYIYAADLLTRYFAQKLPRQMIRAYLPLPLPRPKLARFILLRSWLSIYNLYLFALLLPFFVRTLYIPVSPQAFWLAMLGCFLLGGLNHAIVIWLKSWPGVAPRLILGGVLILAHVVPGALLFPQEYMQFSEALGQAFVNAHPLAFALPLLAIAALQWLSHKGLKRTFYDWAAEDARPARTAKGGMAGLLSRLPHYGHLWALEWKLITRNKRARSNFVQFPLMLPLLLYLLYAADRESVVGFTPLIMMFLGSYGLYHLQFAFSWESGFADFLATRKISTTAMIRARYYFYAAMAWAQFLLLMPFILWLNPGIISLAAGLVLFVTGPVFAMLLHTGVANSTRIDPNGRSFMNTEGVSGRLFITVILVFLSIVPVYVIAFLLPLPYLYGISLTTGGAGMAFVLGSRRWTRATALRFDRNKYHQLNKYRQSQW